MELVNLVQVATNKNSDPVLIKTLLEERIDEVRDSVVPNSEPPK